MRVCSWDLKPVDPFPGFCYGIRFRNDKIHGINYQLHENEKSRSKLVENLVKPHDDMI